MKIGIITMPICANYGGTLQNWALQQVLIRLGHKPITLRFPVGYQGMSSLYYWLRVFPLQLIRFIVHKFIGGKYEMPQTIGVWRKNIQGMEQFVSNNINVTEFLPNLSMEDIHEYDLEAIIVGSDQIWRPYIYDAAKYYFLGFTKDSTITRIAYAPSLALDMWPFDINTTIQLKKMITNFSAISVREESSVKLIKDNLDVDAQWVLDPTMLLDKKDYLDLCKDVPFDQKPFVFAYILDMDDCKKIMIENMAMFYGCSVKYLTAEKVNSHDTIEKWLANFRDSIYVITDSFHGTVFSLIFQKQFYCFYNVLRGTARMDTLRKLTGIENRFIQQPIKDYDINIDYSKIEKRINRHREISMKFLKEALLK